jgi:hypothetical protein
MSVAMCFVSFASKRRAAKLPLGQPLVDYVLNTVQLKSCVFRLSLIFVFYGNFYRFPVSQHSVNTTEFRLYVRNTTPFFRLQKKARALPIALLCPAEKTAAMPRRREVTNF